MSDVDEKRIEFVSDTDVNIPVRWKTEATDLRWNNAIAMAVTIASKIDHSNLWDGYLHFKARTGYSIELSLSFELYKILEFLLREIFRLSEIDESISLLSSSIDFCVSFVKFFIES